MIFCARRTFADEIGEQRARALENDAVERCAREVVNCSVVVDDVVSARTAGALRVE